MIYEIKKLSEPNRIRIYKVRFVDDHVKSIMLTPRQADRLVKGLVHDGRVNLIDDDLLNYYPELCLYKALVNRLHPSSIQTIVSSILFNDCNFAVTYIFDYHD